ncbi:hypothetical protein Poly30_40730 [Planctomycetes bacterium Poly30]|uniref:Cortical protein marker for cell polarity n=2 Tax=Saltatorellus ferox TaxID=2528018 RepID=A0A518EWR2_9BACT|nr:hypothetical protein Poly30_40730 [Planctomycetes bacterium Poly30]
MLLPHLFFALASVLSPSGDLYPDEVLTDNANPTAGDGIGLTVHLDGDWLYVQKYLESIPGFVHCGSVMIYQRGSAGWELRQELTPPRTWAGYPWLYGSSILTLDDYLFVGAPLLSSPNFADGGILIYRRGPQGYELIQFIFDFPGRTASANLGFDLHIHDGDLYSATPAHRYGSRQTGGFVSFELVGTQWTHKETFQFTGANDYRVGRGMAFDQNRMILNHGQEAVVLEEVNGTWSEIQRFGRAVDHTSRAVVTDDQGMVIFGDLSDGFGPSRGAARIFHWDGSQYLWSESLQANDFVPLGTVGDRFGASLSLVGDRLLIGASLASINGTQEDGGAYLFENGVNGWQQLIHFHPPANTVQAATHAGIDVALEEGVAIVGAYTFNVAGVPGVGATFVYELPFGAPVCSGVPNSQGVPGLLSVYGYIYASAGSLRLECEQLPPNSFAILLAGSTPGFVGSPGNSSGNLCISGTAARLGTTQALPSGHAEMVIQTATFPTSIGGPIDPGDTFVFQAWYRDIGGAGASNFTEAKTVTFR